MRIATVAGLAICLFAAAANAAEIEEIVVTGSYVGGDYDMPAITLKRKADYLVQEVRFVNDSRSPDLRREEILKSIEAFLDAARRDRQFDLSYGEGFLQPVNLADDSLQLINDRSRADTNYVDVYVKYTLGSDIAVKRQISELRSFISERRLVGRTEIELLGDIGLSILNPEQYRLPILQQVADDSARLREILGANCTVKISGLEGRVTWERSAIDELTLFIPYATEIACGQ